MTEKSGGKVGNIVSAVKLTIILLGLIIFASIIGTFIPQGLEVAEYIRRYGNKLYSLFVVLGFTDIYHCWWFIVILALLGLNLIFCTGNKIRQRKNSAGLIITHLSILFILGGAIVSAVWGVRGMMSVYEGQAEDSFTTKNGIRKLNFKVYLDDFILERENMFKHQITAYVQDRNKKKTLEVKEGFNYSLEGTNYSFQVLRYLPDFYLDSDKQARTRTDIPNNPALLVKVSDTRIESNQWLFSQFPDFSHNGSENLKLIYKWLGSVKSYKSRIGIIEAGKTVLEAQIEVNRPFKYKGYTFYQSSYNPQELNWTGLQVVSDPGIPLVYFGFVLLNIGMVFVFYINPGSRAKK